jgi:tetratricopeptide (TPR) repeat protein
MSEGDALVTLLVSRATGTDAPDAHEALVGPVVAEHGGEAVEPAGNRLVMAFASATDALRAAVALQQATQGSEVRLSIGLALHAGAAPRASASTTHLPTVVARHLCDRASAGQILCTDVVVGLLAGRLRLGLADLGPLEIDGVPFPVSVFEIRHRPETGEARPGPTLIVGRDAELRRLREWWADVAESRGGFGLVAGDPGIGKTRLVEELTGRVEREGGAVLWGHCYEREGLPYAPIAEALKTLVLASDPDALADDLGGGGPPLAQLVPALRRVLPQLPEAVPLQPDEERARLFDAVAQLLIARSVRAPVVVCLDDLQWADKGTVLMLSHLGRFVPRHRVLIVGTYRPAEVGRDHPLSRVLESLGDDRARREIRLVGLERRAVGRLLQTLADHEVPDEVVEAIASETEGNPFFIREVVRHLVEEGTVYRGPDGRWTTAGPLVDLGIREGVREIIGRRLSRLSDAANRLLSAASAFEAAFRVDVVAAVADLPESDAADALDQARAAHLVHPAAPGAAVFAHDLVRHAVYGELESSDRVRLHRQAAEALEAIYGPEPSAAQSSEIAAQYRHSVTLPGAERGVGPALAAAASAEAAGGYDEAAAFLRIALDLLPPGDDRRAHLLGRLGVVLAWALGFDEAVPIAIEAGEAIAGAEGREKAAEYLAEAAYVCAMAGGIVPSWDLARRGLAYAGDRGRLVSFAQQGLAHAGPRDIAWARMIAFDYQRREAEDAAHPGIPLDSPERRESARILRAARLDPLGPSPMEAVFDDRQEALTSTNLVVLVQWAGEYGTCLPLLGVEARDAESHGRLARAARAGAMVAICQACLGRLPEAEAALERAQALSTRLGTPAFPVIYAQDSLATGLDERWEQVAATVGPLLAARHPALAWARGSFLALAARADARLGQDKEALDLLGELLPWLERSPAWSVNFPFIACHAAETLWTLERTDHAETVERALREKVIAPDFRYGMVDGRLALGRLCALQGRHEEALQWWGEARGVLERQRAATLLAVVDHDEAFMYARRGRRGDAGRARPTLEAARRQFETLGMTGWARRAADLARQLG